MTDQLAVGLYRSTAACYKDGKVVVAYTKEGGQGRAVILEKTSDTTVVLGGEYSLILQPVQGAVVPPLPEVPEFPEFPTPELPVKPEQPIYKPPGGVMPERPLKPAPPIYYPPAETLPGEVPPTAETLPGEAGPQPK